MGIKVMLYWNLKMSKYEIESKANKMSYVKKPSWNTNEVIFIIGSTGKHTYCEYYTLNYAF
jgi:hypothetical protein